MRDKVTFLQTLFFCTPVVFYGIYWMVVGGIGGQYVVLLLLVQQWVVGSPSFYQTSNCLLVKQWVVGRPPPANKGGGNVAVYPPVATYRSHATEEQV